MKIKCDYCGSEVDGSLSNCPNCGGVLNIVRTASEAPKTIDELKAWYKERNLPDESITRFFIGKDIKEPKAFGIYKNNNGDYVVYKNKSDGTRAVRYQGADEEYAVNELYQRLRSEIADQKENGKQKSTAEKMVDQYNRKLNNGLDYKVRTKNTLHGETKKTSKPISDVKAIIMVALMFIAITLVVGLMFFGIWKLASITPSTPSNGTYQYHEEYHSNDYNSGYDFGNYGNWWDDDDSSSSSTWWNDSSDSSDDSWWDSNDDWDWDSDSDWGGSSDWDSGSSDWDSDW